MPLSLQYSYSSCLPCTQKRALRLPVATDAAGQQHTSSAQSGSCRCGAPWGREQKWNSGVGWQQKLGALTAEGHSCRSSARQGLRMAHETACQPKQQCRLQSRGTFADVFTRHCTAETSVEIRSVHVDSEIVLDMWVLAQSVPSCTFPLAKSSPALCCHHKQRLPGLQHVQEGFGEPCRSTLLQLCMHTCTCAAACCATAQRVCMLQPTALKNP